MLQRLAFSKCRHTTRRHHKQVYVCTARVPTILASNRVAIAWTCAKAWGFALGNPCLVSRQELGGSYPTAT